MALLVCIWWSWQVETALFALSMREPPGRLPQDLQSSTCITSTVRLCTASLWYISSEISETPSWLAMLWIELWRSLGLEGKDNYFSAASLFVSDILKIAVWLWPGSKSRSKSMYYYVSSGGLIYKGFSVRNSLYETTVIDCTLRDLLNW